MQKKVLTSYVSNISRLIKLKTEGQTIKLSLILGYLNWALNNSVLENRRNSSTRDYYLDIAPNSPNLIKNNV